MRSGRCRTTDPRGDTIAGMLTRNRGLLIFLLLAVAGHASLIELLLALALGRTEPRGSSLSQIGFVLILAPILLVLLGEWIAEDASAVRWQRLGWGVAFAGAVWHLALDAGCLLLPWLGSTSGGVLALSIGGALAGGVVMALVLRRALRGLTSEDPDAPEPDPAVVPPDERWPGRLAREAALVGGTPIALFLVSLGFVTMAFIGMLRRPAALGPLLLGAGFFGLCGAVSVWMGLERRALLLGQPAPLSHLRPRWLRRAVALATREGLAMVELRGARRAALVYPWEALTRVSIGEVYGNAAVFVQLRPDVVVRRCALGGAAPTREAWATREARARSLQRVLTGADLAIMGVLTDEGPGVLARQLESALQDPSARAGLPSVEEELVRRGR